MPEVLEQDRTLRAIEERGIDPAVELVQVHRVDSTLETSVLRLEARDGLVVEALRFEFRIEVAYSTARPHP